MRATSSKTTALFRLRLPGQRAPRRAVRTRPRLEGLEPRALLSAALTDGGSDFPKPVYSGFVDHVISDAANGTLGESTYRNPSSPIGSTTSNDPNVNIDVPQDGVAPHNETTIAVNPINPQNMIASANDYQLRLNSGGQIVETSYSRAHVTNDGKTWTEYPIDYHGYTSTGDPAVAFDAAGNAYLATLGFVWSQGAGPFVTSPDVLVAHSADGGKTWSTPSRVASGRGTSGSPGTFNDKEYVAAWGNGNAIVTWTVFNQGQGGSYSLTYGSPIYASVTHDGGQTWTQGVPISGNADNLYDQGSVPVVAADGSIYVAFLNTPPGNLTTSGRDQYMVVKVDPATGEPLGAPQAVAPIIDGYTDYPINILGRQTYQDSEFRTWAVGNIAADPKNAQHLAVVWSDMRNSTLPAPADPYSAKAKTNSDVVVSQSFDGGQTWSAPVALTLKNDQFMPWGAYDNNGLLQLGFFDRSYDPTNNMYGYTLASEAKPGSLVFTYKQVTTKLSDPTQGDRWFSGSTPNPAFPHPTTFLGDYSGIAAPPSGGVFATWTDMRNSVNFTTREGWGEDAYFASS